MANKKAASSTNKKANTTKTKEVTATVSTQTKTTPVTKYQAWCAKGNARPNVSAAVAEFIGTFLLTISFLEMQSSPLFVALAVAAIIFIVGGVSGAHLNPAVTVAAWVSNKIKGKTAFLYIVGQALGAGAAWLVASSCLNAISSSSSYLLHSASITSGKEGFLFLIELLGTFILSLGFAVVIRNKQNKTVAALTGGFTVLMALYIAMSVSTNLLTASYTSLTFLNPALALAAGAFTSWWAAVIFIVAPVLGGLVAFAVDEFLLGQTTVEE